MVSAISKLVVTAAEDASSSWRILEMVAQEALLFKLLDTIPLGRRGDFK